MGSFQLSKEQKIILNLASMSICSEPQSLIIAEEQLRDIDWQNVLLECNAQTITLPCFDALKVYKDHVPDEIFQKWKTISARIVKNNFDVLIAQTELVSLLKENGYDYVIMKGTSSADYYVNADLRALGDVDFLINPSKKEEITELLINNGYIKRDVEHISHVIFNKPKAHLEMHFEVAGLPETENKDFIRSFLKPAVENTVETKRDFCIFNAPQHLYHGIIILLHMQHHMIDDGLGLRHLCDWATFVEKTKEQDFWQKEFIPFAEKIGLFKYMVIMTKVCSKYLSITCPDWALDGDEALCDAVMEDILTGGNFGRKDDARARSGMLIAQKGQKDRGAISNVAYKLHKAILLKYPFIKKFWILYPFVYAWKVVKNLFLMMIGKKSSILKMMPEAQKREQIYKQLEVFKTNQTKGEN